MENTDEIKNTTYQYFGLCLYWKENQKKADTLQEENIHSNLNYAILLMANSPNLNSTYHKIFPNISMIAYTIGIQKSNFPDV